MSRLFRFFEAHRPPFLLESIYVAAYQDLGCVTMKHGEDVTVLFQDMDPERCRQQGMDLLGSREKYVLYQTAFQALLDTADQVCRTAIEAGDGEALVAQFLTFLSFYRWTESFCTEGVYQSKNCENLTELEALKTNGRCFLNRFFNGNQSYINQMARRYPSPEAFLNAFILDGKLVWKSGEDRIKSADHLLDRGNRIRDAHSQPYREVKAWLLEMERQYDSLQGMAASRGSAQGQAYVLSSDFENHDHLDELIEQMPMGAVLVSETTSPELVLACVKACAIVTNQGGLGSHAAIISRELRIPCVVGTKVATKIFRTGDLLLVDGDNGVVRR